MTLRPAQHTVGIGGKVTQSDTPERQGRGTGSKQENRSLLVPGCATATAPPSTRRTSKEPPAESPWTTCSPSPVRRKARLTHSSIYRRFVRRSLLLLATSQRKGSRAGRTNPIPCSSSRRSTPPFRPAPGGEPTAPLPTTRPAPANCARPATATPHTLACMKDIHEMIRQRSQSPERVLHPKCGEHQRIKLRGARRPDFFQPERPNNARIGRDNQIVIPDVSRPPDRRIGQNHGQNQNQPPKPIAVEPRGQRWGNGFCPRLFFLGSFRHTVWPVRMTLFYGPLPN